MKNLNAILIGMLLMSTLACNKDTINEAQKVKVTFTGQIIDQNGIPVYGASVRVGNQFIETGFDGNFNFNPVERQSNNAIIRVAAEGYYTFSRAYYVENNAVKPVTIQLIKRVQVGTFDNASGGTVNIPGGPILKFPANSTNSTGNINVFAHYLSPADENLGLKMPGDLRGINTGGEERALATYGMVVVELGNNLGEVQIASGKEVELSMPIVSTQAQHAPAEIALWYYDLEKARWIEEGKALKTADKYVGQVKHFSFWNCDIGLSMVELSGKVYLEDEQHPLTNADVVLTTTAIEWPGFVSTDMNGCFTGAVIMGVTMELKVEIIDQCGSPVSFIQTIGPLNENTTLPPIILDGPDIDFFTISGKLVDCAGGPIGNAYISLMGQDSFFVASNGGFSYELLSCSPVMNIEFQAFDLENLSQTQLQTLIFNSGGPDIHLGDMNICFALDEYIEYDLDGQQYTIIEPYTSILDSAQNDLSVALSGQNGLISIYLTGLDQPGAYPCTLHLSEVYIPQSEAGNITTTLSSLPAHINDYLIGTFSGNFKDTSGNNHTISGSFKSKRRY